MSQYRTWLNYYEQISNEVNGINTELFNHYNLDPGIDKKQHLATCNEKIIAFMRTQVLWRKQLQRLICVQRTAQLAAKTVESIKNVGHQEKLCLNLLDVSNYALVERIQYLPYIINEALNNIRRQFVGITPDKIQPFPRDPVETVKFSPDLGVVAVSSEAAHASAVKRLLNA